MMASKASSAVMVPPPPRDDHHHHNSDEASATSSSSNDDEVVVVKESKVPPTYSLSLKDSNDDNKTTTLTNVGVRLLQSILLEAPLLLLWTSMLALLILQHAYTTQLEPLVESYVRHGYNYDFYDTYHHEFTYYNRHCGI